MTWLPRSPQMPRRITTQRQGRCRKCGRPVPPGTDVYWRRGEGIVHAHREQCGPAQTQTRETRR